MVKMVVFMYVFNQTKKREGRKWDGCVCVCVFFKSQLGKILNSDVGTSYTWKNVCGGMYIIEVQAALA